MPILQESETLNACRHLADISRRAGRIELFLRPMTQRQAVPPSAGLANVSYEIRGKRARRALAWERLGYDIVI